MSIFFVTALMALSASTAAAGTALPDPTRPSDYYVPQSTVTLPLKRDTVFTLTAIRISAVDRTALLNGRLVRVGDVLEAGKVLEINSTDVVVEYERKRLIVPLYSQSITKTIVKEPVK